MTKTILLRQTSTFQQVLWREILISQKLEVIEEPFDPDFEQLSVRFSNLPDMFILDIGLEGLSPYTFSHQAQNRCPVIFIDRTQREISATLRQYALNRGAADLLPGFVPESLLTSVMEAVQRILEILEIPLRPRSLQAAVERAYSDLLVVALRSGLTPKDHFEDRKYFAQTFTGAEAVAWLMRNQLLSEEMALVWGERLLKLRAFHHVTEEQPFRNGPYLYRFCADERPTDEQEKIYLDNLVMQLRKGLTIKTHWQRFKPYPASFTGSEAVQWIIQHQKLSQEAARRLGQRLVEVQLLHHVLDEQPFQATNELYRFVSDDP